MGKLNLHYLLMGFVIYGFVFLFNRGYESILLGFILHVTIIYGLESDTYEGVFYKEQTK